MTAVSAHNSSNGLHLEQERPGKLTPDTIGYGLHAFQACNLTGLSTSGNRPGRYFPIHLRCRRSSSAARSAGVRPLRLASLLATMAWRLGGHHWRPSLSMLPGLLASLTPGSTFPSQCPGEAVVSAVRACARSRPCQIFLSCFSLRLVVIPKIGVLRRLRLINISNPEHETYRDYRCSLK